MKLSVLEKIGYKKAAVTLSVISFIAGLATALLGMAGIILLPITAAFLTLLFSLDTSNKKIMSVAVSLAIVVIDIIASTLVWDVFSYSGLASLLIALVASLGIRLGWRKAACVGISVVLVAIIVFSYGFIFAGTAVGSYDKDSVFEYYGKYSDQLEEEVYELLSVYTVTDDDGDEVPFYSEEYIAELFSTFNYYLIAIVAVFAFLLVGVAFKIISLLVKIFAREHQKFSLWRFAPSGVYAYFYIIVFIMSMFMGGNDTVSIAVNNFSIIFMCIFAYIGFSLFYTMLRTKWRKPVPAFLVILAVVLFLGNIALNILSVFGAILLIVALRRGRSSSGGDDN